MEYGFDPLKDSFEPVSYSAYEHYLQIPKGVKVHFIQSEQDKIKKIWSYFQGSYKILRLLGMSRDLSGLTLSGDRLSTFFITRKGLASHQKNFNLISLRKSKSFNAVLRKMFDDKIVVGFGFQSDIAQLEEFEPFKKIVKFVDL